MPTSLNTRTATAVSLQKQLEYVRNVNVSELTTAEAEEEDFERFGCGF